MNVKVFWKLKVLHKCEARLISLQLQNGHFGVVSISFTFLEDSECIWSAENALLFSNIRQMLSGFLNLGSCMSPVPQIFQGLCACRFLHLEFLPLLFASMTPPLPVGSITTSDLLCWSPLPTACSYAPHFSCIVLTTMGILHSIVIIWLISVSPTRLWCQGLTFAQNYIFSRCLMTICRVNEWLNEWAYYPELTRACWFWCVGHI